MHAIQVWSTWPGAYSSASKHFFPEPDSANIDQSKQHYQSIKTFCFITSQQATCPASINPTQVGLDTIHAAWHAALCYMPAETGEIILCMHLADF